MTLFIERPSGAYDCIHIHDRKSGNLVGNLSGREAYNDLKRALGASRRLNECLQILNGEHWASTADLALTLDQIKNILTAQTNPEKEPR